MLWGETTDYGGMELWIWKPDQKQKFGLGNSSLTNIQIGTDARISRRCDILDEGKSKGAAYLDRTHARHGTADIIIHAYNT